MQVPLPHPLSLRSPSGPYRDIGPASSLCIVWLAALSRDIREIRVENRLGDERHASSRKGDFFETCFGLPFAGINSDDGSRIN